MAMGGHENMYIYAPTNRTAPQPPAQPPVSVAQTAGTMAVRDVELGRPAGLAGDGGAPPRAVSLAPPSLSSPPREDDRDELVEISEVGW